MRQRDAGELEPPPIVIKGASYSPTVRSSRPASSAEPGAFDVAAEQAKLAAYLAAVDAEDEGQGQLRGPASQQLADDFAAAMGSSGADESLEEPVEELGEPEAQAEQGSLAEQPLIRRRPGSRIRYRKPSLSRRQPQ